MSQSIDVRFEKECNVLHALNPGVESVIVIEGSGLLLLKWSPPKKQINIEGQLVEKKEVDTEFTSSYVREFLSLVKMTTDHYDIGDPMGVMLEGLNGFFLVFKTKTNYQIVILIKEETSRSTLRYRL